MCRVVSLSPIQPVIRTTRWIDFKPIQRRIDFAQLSCDIWGSGTREAEKKRRKGEYQNCLSRKFEHEENCVCERILTRTEYTNWTKE